MKNSRCMAAPGGRRPVTGLGVLRLLGLLGIMLLAACTTPPPRTPADTLPAPALPAASAAESAIDLRHPLSQDDAVRLALQHSPALQALVAEGEAQALRTRAAARPALLRLSLERLSRGEAVEWERSVGIGLLDWLVWPWRSRAADTVIEARQLELSVSVMRHLHAVRRHWVQAVAAQQRAQYQADVHEAVATQATLAQRMQDAGHLSLAQRLAYDAAAASARIAQVRTQQDALGAREALVRLLGLTEDDAARLVLPERLPPVPAELAWQTEQAAEAARGRRMDLRLSELRWRAAQGTAGTERWTSLFDLALSWQHNTATGEPRQTGPGIGLTLTHADFGAATRAAASEEERAALARLAHVTRAAESQLRERLQAYHHAHAVARHAAEVLQPIRQQLLEEQLKRYNGMLIGPLQLLDEARRHVDSVITALDAQRDFWLADAALTGAIDGLTPVDESD